MTQGFQCLVGARIAEAGRTREQVAQAMTALNDRLSLIFLVDTLEYLNAAGELALLRRGLGPCSTSSPIRNRACPRGTVGTRGRSRKAEFRGSWNSPGPPRYEWSAPRHRSFAYCGFTCRDRICPADRRNTGPRTFRCYRGHPAEIGPTVAVHTGPDALGLAFYRE